MPAVSVIIPVYGVEKYIERCARSLFEQTLEDLEYIFVDDCSFDDSITVLKKVIEDYPLRKSQIKILTMPFNSGIAAARRKGIENSTGDYLIHCDSDDWVECDMYERLLNKAKEDSSDIVVCDYFEEIGEQIIYRQVLHGEDLCASVLLSNASLWNRLIHRNCVFSEDIVYPIENIAEDCALFFQYATKASKYSYINKAYYHYVRRKDSILGVRTNEKLLDRQIATEKNFKIILDCIERNGLKNCYKNEVTHQCLYIKNIILPVLAESNDCLKIWKRTCKEANSRVFFCSRISMKEKMNFGVTYLGLYPLYKRITR